MSSKMPLSLSKSEQNSGSVLPAFILDDAPVLSAEGLEDYQMLAENIAAVVLPANRLDWTFLKDAIDALWEVRRYRRIKKTTIEIAQREQVEELLKETIDSTKEAAVQALELLAGAKSKAFAWSTGGEAKKRIDETLANKGYYPDEILSRAVVAHCKTIDEIDRLIMLAEARRDQALRNIEHFSPVFAARMASANAKIIEAEFREVNGSGQL